MKGKFRNLPDVRVDTDPFPCQFGTGDWRAVVTRCSGTMKDEIILLDGKVIPQAGMAFDLDFATTARWQFDLLIEEYVFWDCAP